MERNEMKGTRKRSDRKIREQLIPATIIINSQHIYSSYRSQKKKNGEGGKYGRLTMIYVDQNLGCDERRSTVFC